MGRKRGCSGEPEGKAAARPSREALERAFQGAMGWLLRSGGRTADGGLRSIYRPADGSWVCYGGGLSCLQCTAGGVLAFLAAARRADGAARRDLLQAGIRSAGHMLGILRGGEASGAGAIPCGLRAATVKTLHTETAIRSFLAVHEETGESRWLEAAATAAGWAVRNLQRADGSFRSGAGFTAYSRLRRRLVDVAPLGAAAYVATLRRTARLAGRADLHDAAGRLHAWLRRQEDGEGGFPMYRYRALTRPVAALFHGGAAEILRGCLRYHPSPNAWMIEAFLEDGNTAGARRVSDWFLPRIGPNGLLYQYYFRSGVGEEARGSGAAHAGGIVPEPYGARSVEEDVMPTASLALLWMREPSLMPDGVEEMLGRIAAGVLYAQVRSEDPRLDGGVRGLPLHPAYGEDIYSWDTAYAALFLSRYLDREAGGGIR